MVFSTYKKQRIHFASLGFKPLTIAEELERLKCSRVSIYKFLKPYRATGSIGRRIGSGRPSKATAEIKQIVDDQMRLDDEMIPH
jgi:transposase